MGLLRSSRGAPIECSPGREPGVYVTARMSAGGASDLRAGLRAVASSRLILFLLLVAQTFTAAEWHTVGYFGGLGRIKADRLSFSSFRSGPVSTLSPVFGIEGGRSIWKVHLDATFLRSTTGETDVIIGPGKTVNQTTKGTSLFFDGGGAWPFWHIAGFETLARVGYGTARVRVPTDVPIQDNRRFWTYGLVATRNIGSHYLLRLDVRNVHFRREEIPQTLGRFNAIALAGFGLRF